MRKIFFAIAIIFIAVTPTIAHEIGMQHDHYSLAFAGAITFLGIIALFIAIKWNKSKSRNVDQK